MNGCAPDALLRNSFAIQRIVSMARYLQLKTQEIHEALQEAHKVIGLAKIIGTPDRPNLTEQDAALAARHQDALASTASQAERARAAEHNNIELQGQLALAQSQLARVITDNILAIEQVRAQASDLDDRLKASIASEREVSARSAQQATSFAATEACFQQQLASLQAHDVRIRGTLSSLRWPEAPTTL